MKKKKIPGVTAHCYILFYREREIDLLNDYSNKIKVRKNPYIQFLDTSNSYLK